MTRMTRIDHELAPIIRDIRGLVSLGESAVTSMVLVADATGVVAKNNSIP